MILFAIAALILTWLLKPTKKSAIRRIAWLITVSLIAWFCLPIPTSRVFQAKRFCETLAERLEVERAKTGSYPKSILSVLKENEPIPFSAKPPTDGYQICRYRVSDDGSYFNMEVSNDGIGCFAYSFRSGPKDWYEGCF